MKIKCGHYEVDITSKDLILDNGSCYIIITQTVGKGDYYTQVHPNIAKNKFKKLLKEGKIRLSKRKYNRYGSGELDLYEFVEEENNGL